MLQLRMKDCPDSEVKPGLEQTNEARKDWQPQQNVQKYPIHPTKDISEHQNVKILQ